MNWDEVSRKVREQRERQAVLPEVEQRPDGSWVARKLGCTGMGATEAQAVDDLDYKVELTYDGPQPHPEIRDEVLRLRPAMDELLKKLRDE